MTNQRNQARSIFLSAIENYSPQDWPGYLDEACADDAALRRRVERLLRAQARLGSFRDDAPPASATAADHPAICERPGTVIGPYKLQEQIGEGGMGLVFVADQQEPIKRRVAVKVLKPGMDSRQVIARFEAERQALAMMDHPNIAKVLDAGATESGRPYFVMELVKGVPITEYCDQNRLTTRQRLELFLPICQAVQHAHQKGIIHRDLKPTNVLVTVHDVAPLVKIIDFGIAKAMGQQLTDNSVYTGFAQLVGTPLYMSPEQAGLSGLDVDTRSDIYSLGVLLYELLTGTTPFDAQTLKKADYEEMRRIIREDEPPRPSTRLSTLQQAALSTVAERHGVEARRLSHQVRGELDWIVMKALEKDRNRRYETASALAQDIERHLHDEPVQACPPSAGYRLRKLVRKHRVGVLLTAGLMGVLLLALAGLVASNYFLREEQNRTKAALEAEATARQAEVKRRELARRALDAMSSQVIQRWLLQQPELSPDQKAYLRQALKWYEELAADTGEDEQSRAGIAAAHHQIAVIQNGLGQTAEAETGYRKALREYAQLTEDFPGEILYRSSLADTNHSLAQSLRFSGRLAEAEQEAYRALELYRKLVAEDPKDNRFRYALLQTIIELTYVQGQALQGPDKWTQNFRTALEMLNSLPPDFPDRKTNQLHQALVHGYLGLAEIAAGQTAEGEKKIQYARWLHAKLTPAILSGSAQHLAMAEGAQAYIAAYFAQVNRRDEAESVYREVLQVRQRLATLLPGVPNNRYRLSGWLHNLSLFLLKTGRFEEADQYLAQEQDIVEKLAQEYADRPEYRASLASNLMTRGVILQQAGRNADAEAAWTRALDLSTPLDRDFPRSFEYAVILGGVCCNLAKLRKDRGDVETALPLYDRAILTLEPIAKAKYPPPEAREFLRNSYSGRAVALDSLRRYAEALASWDKAVELEQQGLPTRRLHRATTLIRMGDHARTAAEVKELAKLPKLSSNDLYNLACLNALGSAAAAKDQKLLATQREKLAEEYARDALGLLRDAFAKGYRDVEHLQKDPDFDSLRARRDFQKMVRELEANGKTAK